MENCRKLSFSYHQIPSLSVPLKIQTLQKIAVIILKNLTILFYNGVLHPKDQNGMTNEPCHEMVHSVLRKLILQMRMRSHPVVLDV